MSQDKAVEKIRLRPHHAYCRQFPNQFPAMEEAFGSLGRRVKEVLKSGVTTLIEVTEGCDDLCLVCAHYHNNRCEGPDAGEEIIRKWDGIIREGLGLAYGDRITAERLRALIKEKSPLAFCTRCKVKEGCGVFSRKPS